MGQLLVSIDCVFDASLAISLGAALGSYLQGFCFCIFCVQRSELPFRVAMPRAFANKFEQLEMVCF